MRTSLRFVASILLALASLSAGAASVCHDALQDKVAWNYSGSRHWASANIDTLCSGAEDTTGPARCFQTVMHQGINWGGGTRWQWSDAQNLCKGARDADARVSCFVGQIASGRDQQTAIASCQQVGGSGGYRANSSSYVGGAPVLRQAPRPKTLTLRQNGAYLANWSVQWTRLGYLPSVELDEKNIAHGAVRKLEIPADIESVRVKAHMVGIGTPRILDEDVGLPLCITLKGSVFNPSYDATRTCN